MKSTSILISIVISTFALFYTQMDDVEKEAKTTTTNEEATSNLPQLIYSAYEDKVYNWAGEEMPTNFDNKERLDRELSVNSYWQSNTLLNIKAAHRYFPTMERILAEHGVPDDFKYLAVAESNLRNVTSPASAKGFWQFRKLAAKEMKLEVYDEVDERYHLEKSTVAAAKYIKSLYNRFGSWTDAAAAYNVGPTNYSKIKTRQKESSFYDLNLNHETNRYVFRLIAFKEIMSDPQKFGFQVQEHEKYSPLDFYNVEVNSTITNLSEFAHQHGISYRTLKVFNPWLIDSKLTVKSKTYLIKIPRK